MAKCKEIGAQACSHPFGCNQQHFEFQLVDDKGDGGNAIEFFCINTLSPQQFTLLQQFIKSVTNKAPSFKRKSCRVPAAL
jgi:hypothetical protein